MSNRKITGEELRRRREIYGFTTQQMAAVLGIKPRDYREYEETALPAIYSGAVQSEFPLKEFDGKKGKAKRPSPPGWEWHPEENGIPGGKRWSLRHDEGITEQDMDDIRNARGKELQKVTAARYGITQAHVSKIQLGKVTAPPRRRKGEIK